MKIAVLMSSYNGEKYIKEQIDSILCQKGDFQLDLWVRDDGSGDSTQKILKMYSDEKKLNWYTGENLGPAHSFFDLIKHCEGYDYYAFADQDDYWKPGKIQSGISSLDGIEVPALYFANADLVDAELKSFGRKVYKVSPKTDYETLLCAGGLLGCTMIFNRYLALLIQEREVPNKVVMHDFYVAAVCSAMGGKIIYDDTAQMLYRQHGNNVVGVSHNKLDAVKKIILNILSKAEISISEQAEEIERIYFDLLNSKREEWLRKIIYYRRSYINRIWLACSCKTKYVSWNMAIKVRLAILLGNK